MFACGCAISREDSSSYIGLHTQHSDEGYLAHFPSILDQLRDPKPHYVTLMFQNTYCKAHNEIRQEGEDMARLPPKVYRSVRECRQSQNFEYDEDFQGCIGMVNSDMSIKLAAQAWLATRESGSAKGREDTGVTKVAVDSEGSVS